MDDNVNPSAGPADEAELMTAMALRLSALKLQSPEGIAGAIKPSALREVCQRLVKAVPKNAGNEKIFASLLRISGWEPEWFTRRFPRIETLKGAEMLRFGGTGETPFRSRRVIK